MLSVPLLGGGASHRGVGVRTYKIETPYTKIQILLKTMRKHHTYTKIQAIGWGFQKG